MPVDAHTLYETAVVAIADAIDASDFSTARKQHAKARTYASLLNNTSAAGRTTTRDAAFKNLADLTQAIDEAERAAQGGGDIRMVPIGFGRVG
jgi:hypothetical protein